MALSSGYLIETNPLSHVLCNLVFNLPIHNDDEQGARRWRKKNKPAHERQMRRALQSKGDYFRANGVFVFPRLSIQSPMALAFSANQVSIQFSWCYYFPPANLLSYCLCFM